MNASIASPEIRAAWFVGASFNATEDQTDRFVNEGIWENGYQDKLLDIVRSMRPGDRIAIKSSYTRKKQLPFDGRGHTVSVLAIKAIGTITENMGDGRHVRVKWTRVDPPREWYFYTNRGTVWRVPPGESYADGLLAFTFEGKPQDLDRFRNEPYWRERFGDTAQVKNRFPWTQFYEAVATKLLDYRANRGALIQGVKAIAARVDGLGHLSEDQYADGSAGFVRDICPFTTLGLLNRHTTEANRKVIAGELAKFLGVAIPVPQSFDGIPVLNNLKSWYFPYENIRDPDHIESLWSVFAKALAFGDSDDASARDQFVTAFDNANGRRVVAWNLTFGLYWARPWAFVPLDRNSVTYITKKLGIAIPRNGPKRRCNGADYTSLMDTLEARFLEATYPAHSYPELSLEAWKYEDPTGSAEEVPEEEADEAAIPAAAAGVVASAPPEVPKVLQPYDLSSIVSDGCFLDISELTSILERLRSKRNVILQGPPGTGKSWLARRLAYALIGQKDEGHVRVVQFHPNLSYEDFVRGWRPGSDGRLAVANGTFMQAVELAQKDWQQPVVIVIEEINRGNPAQIFGEMLTLLEAGKRTPDEAIELCYPGPGGDRRPVHVPKNLYVIGTMNLADRSLALMDMALRRRFAFVDLEPRFGITWRTWVAAHRGMEPALASEIEGRIGALNERIASDSRLGKQYRVGHSYVTPDRILELGSTKKWFHDVVRTEIRPLLEEYWFDTPSDATSAVAALLKDW